MPAANYFETTDIAAFLEDEAVETFAFDPRRGVYISHD